MTDQDDKLQRLLDGQIDEAEIATDPVLASLAERIFGLMIEPITPTKPSRSTGLPPAEMAAENPQHVSAMVEVIPGAEPAPLPELPMIPTPVAEPEKKGKKLLLFGLLSTLVSAGNIFGLFGFLNSQCTAAKCTEEATRINWIDIHNIGNEMGWSMPFPEMGIPDYVALVSSILVLLVALRRR